MKRFSASEKWDDPWFRKMRPKFKLFFNFLCDKCDNAGVWVIDMDSVVYYLGEKIDQSEAIKAFDGRVVDMGNGKWLLTKFIGFQYSELTPSCIPHRKILDLVKRHGIVISDGVSTLSTTLVSTLGVGIAHTQQEKEKDKDKDKDKEEEKEVGGVGGARRFTPPSLEEMLSYGIELHLPPLEVHACRNHFLSNGWKVGKALASMKDWRASMRTWQSNSEKYAPIVRPNGHRPLTLMDIRTVIQAKDNEAQDLRRKFCSEVATGDTWSDAQKRQEYFNLKREMKELNHQICGMA